MFAGHFSHTMLHSTLHAGVSFGLGFQQVLDIMLQSWLFHMRSCPAISRTQFPSKHLPNTIMHTLTPFLSALDCGYYVTSCFNFPTMMGYIMQLWDK